MVLWEMTVITAYFLGLKRTYRIALRIHRRLVGPNHPKIRQFLSRYSSYPSPSSFSRNKSVPFGFDDGNNNGYLEINPCIDAYVNESEGSIR